VHARCLANQDEEGRLKSVLALLVIAKNPVADTQNHRPVSPDERREGCLVPMLNEATKKLPVRQAYPFPESHDSAQMLHNLEHRRNRHVLPWRLAVFALLISRPGTN
jgi:hypothetical protein